MNVASWHSVSDDLMHLDFELDFSLYPWAVRTARICLDVNITYMPRFNCTADAVRFQKRVVLCGRS
jgi:hypothetical protein